MNLSGGCGKEWKESGMTVSEHRIDSEIDSYRAVQQVNGAEPVSVARATGGARLVVIWTNPWKFKFGNLRKILEEG